MSVTGLLVVVVGVAVVAARAHTLWRKRNRPAPAGETRRPPPSPSAPRSEESSKPSDAPGDANSGLGPLGRLGTWMARHARAVTVAWVLAMLALAYPISQVEQSLAGFGWAATGSESVQARDRIGDHFAGRNAAAFMVVVHSDSTSLEDPAFQETVQRVTGLLRDHPEATASVVPPKAPWISPDRCTTVVAVGHELRADVLPGSGHRLRAVRGHALPPGALRAGDVGCPGRRTHRGHRASCSSPSPCASPAAGPGGSPNRSPGACPRSDCPTDRNPPAATAPARARASRHTKGATCTT